MTFASGGVLGDLAPIDWTYRIANGVVFGGLAIGMSISHGAAVAAGFGWYSYAGVITFDLGSPELGASLFRELLTFLVAPAIVARLDGVTSIAPGGATTMDVTRPLTQNVAGDEFVIPALYSGFVLSVFSVVLLPLCI